MTPLRQMMADELVRRNYSEATARAYLRSVAGFAKHFNRRPDQLSPEHVREYAAHLFEVRQLSSSAVSQHVAALRFFYVKTLRRAWIVEDTPYPKKEKSLPLVLSVEEVDRLIDAADTPYHRTLLMTAYGTGARRAEIVNLQIADIDKSMQRIHIREGKGGKDREVPLSPRLYEELRQHYLRLGRKPKVWLFPGGRYHSSDTPNRFQGGLLLLSHRRPARRYSQTRASPHPQALLCHSPLRCGNGSLHHSGVARPLRPEGNGAVHPPLQQAPEGPHQPARSVASIH